MTHTGEAAQFDAAAGNGADAEEKTPETAHAYFEHDRFATEVAGIVIESIEDHGAVCSLDIEPRHCNAKGGVMGGVLYTLGDFSASIADWQPGVLNATIDSSMQFLAVAKGTHLTATASAERHGRTMGFYRVVIEDDLGTSVAAGSYTLAHRPMRCSEA